MAEHNEIGAKGEELAAVYLINGGFEVLEKNYRYHKGEIDIISRLGNELVFVEVKTRTNVSEQMKPEDAIDKNKMALLVRTATGYLQENMLEDIPCRFDVIAIHLIDDSNYEIMHFEDAFTPDFSIT